MSSAEVVVVARWETTATTEVLSVVRELRLRSLEEPGCVGYEVFTSDGAVMLIERYRSSEAVEAHRTSPHYQTLLVERILPLLGSRRVEVLSVASSQ